MQNGSGDIPPGFVLNPKIISGNFSNKEERIIFISDKFYQIILS